MGVVFPRFKESIMVTLTVASPAASTLAPALDTRAIGSRVRQLGASVWRFFESVGSVRAAAELQRRARALEDSDPERARVLHEASLHCLAKV